MQSSPSANRQILPWAALVFGIAVGVLGAEAVRAFLGPHRLTTILFWQHVGLGLGFGSGIAITFVVLNTLTGWGDYLITLFKSQGNGHVGR